ncbi:putative receptor-like protein kinase At3g47110 [Magnolia sinica]|uniref:putative receptor-like protein kinase At3g47110 n=1 Tax=Magnolia sinica TaxID=86752 RepID=UPI0026599B1B|nr:putative receptor-like protein kinase At3g47110 [Magnolia sinica]
MGSVRGEFSQLVSLEVLSISENEISGTIPPPLYNLSSIKCLDVGWNRLQGNLPPNIGLTLPNLQELHAEGNQFTGPIPVSLSNASRLLLIKLGNNSFSGSVPMNFGRLKGLSKLYLGGNRLGIGKSHDLSFLHSLTNCSSLQELDVSDNRLSGSLPDFMGNLSTQLRILWFGSNRIFGSIPSGIQNLVSLTTLRMEYNSLTGIIPIGVVKLNELRRLSLGGNELSGEIPSSLGNITQLYLLDLFGNNLWGTVPSSIGNFTFLQFIHLDNNNLSGTLPRSLFSIPSLTELHVESNSFTGDLPFEVSYSNALGRFSVSNNKLSGEIPSPLGNCLSLEYLCLDGNLFQGLIPPTFANLKGLRLLDLSRNNLSGMIPQGLETFALEYLNLSFNNLEGELPKQGVFGNVSQVSVLGNSKLCGGFQGLQLRPCPIQVSKKHRKSLASKLKISIIIVVLCLVSLSCFFTSLYWVRKSKRKPFAVPSVEDKLRRKPAAVNKSRMKRFAVNKLRRKPVAVPSAEDSFMKLSYAELSKATGGFSAANLVGTGRSGAVYKGFLDRYKTVVAVKVFNLERRGAMRGFMSECETMGNIRHRNIVRILTCCSSIDFKGNDFKALVYEYMPNGSLDKWLHSDGQEQLQRNLNFLQRLNIAIDVASALIYLYRRLIIHRDLKPSNILLDNDMIARVGDFGLAKFLSEVAQTRTVVVMGTAGYIALEYGMGSKPSTQGDAYRYGIFLLEMITGKGPTNDMFKDNLTLHHFAKLALPERVMEIVDPRLLEEEAEVSQCSVNHINTMNRMGDCLISMVRIGVMCSMESPRERMDMEVVLTEKNAIKDLYLGDEIHQDKQVIRSQLLCEGPSYISHSLDIIGSYAEKDSN